MWGGSRCWAEAWAVRCRYRRRRRTVPATRWTVRRRGEGRTWRPAHRRSPPPSTVHRRPSLTRRRRAAGRRSAERDRAATGTASERHRSTWLILDWTHLLDSIVNRRLLCPSLSLSMYLSDLRWSYRAHTQRTCAKLFIFFSFCFRIED